MALEQTLTGEDAVRIASFGLIEDPHAPIPVPRDYGRPMLPVRIIDHLIESILARPHEWAPANPYYVKNHVNAPGTVRQWFRTMRAADFERDCIGAAIGPGQPQRVPRWYYFDHGNAAWTLFDTQKVVNRETAAHYLKPAKDEIFFVYGGRVLGKIEGVGDLATCHERGGQPEWDSTDYNRDVTWLGFDRSTTPWIDFGRSSYPDDARRGERRKHDGPADEFIAWLVRETAADTWDPSVVAEVRDHLAEIIRRSERR